MYNTQPAPIPLVHFVWWVLTILPIYRKFGDEWTHLHSASLPISLICNCQTLKRRKAEVSFLFASFLFEFCHSTLNGAAVT